MLKNKYKKDNADLIDGLLKKKSFNYCAIN